VDRLVRLVRNIPDFPQAGIQFKDITPLISDREGMQLTTTLLAERLQRYEIDELVAIESRGFIFGAGLAMHLGLPLQLTRKPGKLPWKKIGVDYALEYGSDRVEMHADAIIPNRRYVIVDDLIATGGTAAATAELIRQQQGIVSCCAFVIELRALNGRERLHSPVESLLVYDT